LLKKNGDEIIEHKRYRVPGAQEECIINNESQGLAAQTDASGWEFTWRKRWADSL
jgi:hypothetical protein